jgi:hypothetical protein
MAVDFTLRCRGQPMILSAIAEKLKRRSKDDFKGRHFEASLILQAVCWYLRYPGFRDRLFHNTRLDSRTCNYCLSVDGRTIERDDPFGRNTIFHSSCRGIWVSILMDEEEKPSIGGIPQSLKDRFGDAVNDSIQPKTPKTNKNSLARREIEKRLKR